MKKPHTYILTGLMSIIPIALTYWIIKSLFLYFSIPGKTLISYIFSNRALTHKYIIYLEYFLGFLLTILFLYLLGIIISNVLGKKIYSFFEGFLTRIPVVNKIYTSIKQITSSLSMPGSKSFQKVVLIEYPRKGLWTISMVTGETKSKNNLYYNVLVPTTPNPTSGYLLFIKSTDTIKLDMTVEEGLRIIISGGMISPGTININD